MPARVNRTTTATKAASHPAAAEATPGDDVPSFTTGSPTEVVYDGPVLFRVDGREYRMRSGRTFGASLVWLNTVRRGITVRNAELGAIEDLVGPQALDELLKVSELEPAMWGTVVRRAYDHLLGKFEEEPEGN